MTIWQSLIYQKLSNQEDRFFKLELVCNSQYPEVPPYVRFISKVNYPFVDSANGSLIDSKLEVFNKWSKDTLLIDLLQSIQKEMQKYKHLKQPNESEIYN